MDCACNNCRSACNNTPGWFKPGEAEKTAELLGVTLPELFKTKLVANFWEADKPVFLLSPATVNAAPGSEAPSDPRGRCVFFTKGKCDIHAAKPFECRELHHTDSNETVRTRHEDVMKAWKGAAPQKQIRELLGRKPVTPEPMSIFDWLF